MKVAHVLDTICLHGVLRVSILARCSLCMVRHGTSAETVSILKKNNYFYCFLSEYHRLCDDIWCEIPSNIHGHGIFLIASHVDTWKSTIRRKTAIYFMFMWRHFIDFTKSRHEHGRGLFECVGAWLYQSMQSSMRSNSLTHTHY